jgi:hypothetical protein
MRDLTNVSIHFRTNGVWISCSKDEDAHKSKLYIDEKRLKEECEKYGREFKYMKGFQHLHIGFGQIDYYDSCNTYYVPSAVYKSRVAQISNNDYNTIPKDWEKDYMLSLSEVKTMRPFNKFLEILGIELTKKQLNGFRKAIKEQADHNIYFDEEEE